MNRAIAFLKNVNAANVSTPSYILGPTSGGTIELDLIRVEYLTQNPKRVDDIGKVKLIAHEGGCLTLALDYWRDSDGKAFASQGLKGGELVAVSCPFGCTKARVIIFARDPKN